MSGSEIPITAAAELDQSEFRPCGSCALCCKVTPIEGSNDLDKPAGQWCKHWAKSTGCSVYPDREEVCRVFHCLWRAAKIPEELSPLKTKCVLAIYKEGVLIVYVDPSYPDAWKKEDMARYLTAWGRRFVIQIGVQRYWVHPNHMLPLQGWAVTKFRETINVKEILE